MQRFINFIAKYKELITFTALVVMSLSLISLGNVAQIGGFRTVVIGSIGWLQELFAWVPKPGALQTENRAVRELNLKLSSEVTRMRHSLIENKKLRDLMNMKDKTEYSVISSEIIGKTTVEMRNYITLDKGKQDGIEKGMAVRNDAGLVGTIVIASDNYSLVELIINRNVKIAGKVQRTLVSGILVWEGGENLFMKNIRSRPK